MCGIAGYIGFDINKGNHFVRRADTLLIHRGPDDSGIYTDEHVALLHRRLSILDLSPSGHQPMTSSCGRYTIVFNGEIYNHLELRKQYLSNHSFRGHSDTETIIELFRLKQEQMLYDMVGMWGIIIWDRERRAAFVSRDRYGQKPVYVRRDGNDWYIASEMKPLLKDDAPNVADATAVVEYLALGNYGHLGTHSFFRDIAHFPQGHYAWISPGQESLNTVEYWKLPEIQRRNQKPFDEQAKKELHDSIMEGTLSQTLADVPIGITLSGGIDSSIIAGILARHCTREVHVFTAQARGSKFDESRYVDAVIAMNKNGNFKVHRKDLEELSLKDNLQHYIDIQEEPFGDPSIMAHGFLMGMAADAGIKVILNGQGADELFFGYNNMAQAILLQQLRTLRFHRVNDNLMKMNLGRAYLLRTLLKTLSPSTEQRMRRKSRIERRTFLTPELRAKADDELTGHYNYAKPYDVWCESIYGVHLPHLVQYDDRNGMSRSIEGRMPFLDHRIAELVATIRPNEFLMNGKRKYLLREACREFLPDEVYNRTDKIGFYTPLIDALYRDEKWALEMLAACTFTTPEARDKMVSGLKSRKLNVPAALLIWRSISVSVWMNTFNVRLV